MQHETPGAAKQTFSQRAEGYDQSAQKVWQTAEGLDYQALLMSWEIRQSR